MKSVLLLVTLLALSSIQALAAHSVTLTWTASSDTGVAYNVYRIGGACPTSAPTSAAALLNGGFVLANSSPITALTFTDTEVTPGKFCYAATATLNGAESVPSNLAAAVILPAPPTSLSVSAVN